MSEPTGEVQVVGGARRELYSINGDGGVVTVRDAVAKFFPAGTDLSRIRVNRNGRRVEDLDTPLVDSDLLVTMTETLASGGAKGATS